MEFTKIKVISRSTDFNRMTQDLLRSTDNGQRSHPDGSLREKNISTYHEYLRVLRSTVNGQRSHPDGSLLSVVYSLLTSFYQLITGIKQKYPCDTRDTWRPVNAPQGNLWNQFHQLIIISPRIACIYAYFLSTDYRD